MTTKLCVTVTGSTMEELRRARDAASRADLVEVRLDGVDRPDGAGAIEGRLRPVIVTCRPEWEGGRFRGSEEERRRILQDAIAAGAEFVDLELCAPSTSDLVRLRRGRGVVVSMHVFGHAVPDVPAALRALRATGAEVVKLAYDAQSLSDTLPLFEIAGSGGFGREGGQDHVLLAMGPAGVATRILAARLGNRWTYAGNGVAPGQLPAALMLDEYKFRRIRADADLYGVVGNPVTHSLSPVMHNAGFAHGEMNAVYLPLQAKDFDDFVHFARVMKLRGASITAPFKVAALDHAQDVDALATEVGAINTLHMRGGRWVGANTDVHGFITPLKGRMALKGTRAAVLGAGGAARAVAVALKHEGAAVRVCARRHDEAAAVAALVGVNVGDYPPPPGSWDVLVNATSVGGRPTDASPMDGVRLDGEIVFDLIYTPLETALLVQARQAGCWTIGGIEMLIAQAEKQFEMWTGAAPPPDLFRQAVDGVPGWQTGVRS